MHSIESAEHPIIPNIRTISRIEKYLRCALLLLVARKIKKKILRKLITQKVISIGAVDTSVCLLHSVFSRLSFVSVLECFSVFLYQKSFWKVSKNHFAMHTIIKRIKNLSLMIVFFLPFLLAISMILLIDFFRNGLGRKLSPAFFIAF